jgi:hypothetical protein
MYEVRYYGKLVARFETMGEANGYRDRRLQDEREGPAFDREKLTVAPAGPVELFCNGAFLDSFATKAEAEAARATLLEQYAAEPRRMGAPAVTAEQFEIKG